MSVVVVRFANTARASATVTAQSRRFLAIAVNIAVVRGRAVISQGSADGESGGT